MATAVHEQVGSETPHVDTIGPFSPEQFAAAKQAYEGLHVLFAPKSTAPVNAVVATDHKTMGDVGDKALDMLQDGAEKMLDLLGQGAAQIAATTEKAAPTIWKIMVKQQIAYALTNIIGPLLMMFGSWIFHLIINAAYGDLTAGSDLAAWKAGLGLVAPIIGGIIAMFWLITALMESLQQLVNPQYFAARDLIRMITRRQ